jgi:hypothetical protein
MIMYKFLSVLVILLPAGEVTSFVLPSETRIISKASIISSPRHFMSDIPQDNEMKSAAEEKGPFDELVGYLPPPPEDQFTMTGDIAVLFQYSYIGHSIDDYVVNSVFDSSESAREAIQTLDPLQEVVHMQTPVWLDHSSPQLTDQIISMNAQGTLLNHWGPLFSSAGLCSVALCSCWLLAGYLHRAFLFENSLDCDTPTALQKTLETWITMVVMMVGLTFGSNALVGQTPLLQTWLGCHCLDFVLTKDDMLLLLDSASVLFAWRYMANTIAQYLR